MPLERDDMDDDSAAMKSVIDSMGDAARSAKVRKYAPKPKLMEESHDKAPPPEADGGEPLTADDLERLISGAKDW